MRGLVHTYTRRKTSERKEKEGGMSARRKEEKGEMLQNEQKAIVRSEATKERDVLKTIRNG